jgi:hypothetical protein
LGYDNQPRDNIDGGFFDLADASSRFDAATTTDASAPPDAEASALADAASRMDASTTADAGRNMDTGVVDAGAEPTPDAAFAVDAATTLDAAAADGCRPDSTRDYCLQLPALARAPQLDGTLDCGPGLIDLAPSGWNSDKTYAGDHPSRYAAAWRPDGLYFYVEVDDTLLLPARASDVDPWCGDGVELYADSDGVYDSAPDYDDPGAIQLLATAPALTISTALAVDARYHTRSEKRAGDWTPSRHISVPRANGYALEAFITAADLELSTWTLSAGARVGIDIAINVSVSDPGQQVGCGHYLGQYYLRVSSLPCNSDDCRPYSNAAAFCSPLLEL